MSWEVIATEEFETWFKAQARPAQAKLDTWIAVLAQQGPTLPAQYSKPIVTSRHRMRELRVQVKGNPFRVLHVFDPGRNVVLLLGGDKTGDDRWYEENVPKADALYDAHLEELRRKERET